MLYTLCWILISCMIALAGMQVLFIVYYRKILQQPNSRNLDFPNAKLAEPNLPPVPKVSIVLCLRGPDPTLPECLAGLLQQRYTNFDLHLIVDSDDDPAIPIAKTALQTFKTATEVHWHTVVNHSNHCSLKCSALVTAVMSIASQDFRPEIVAFVDADALVDPDWLNRLVAPLLNSFDDTANGESYVIGIGATTGNRWFEPTDNNLGSQFRAAWNAAALPQMQIYQIAWGGSLAMKFETIQECNLLDRWSRAFCEDTLLTDAFQEHRLRVHRVPDLIVVNQESTTLLAALRWIGRQLLTMRLHHRAWRLVLLHALLGGFCFFSPLIISAATVISNRPLAIGTAIAWCLQLGFNVGLLDYIRRLNMNAIEQLCLKPTNSNGILGNFIVAVVLQAIYPFLAIGVAFRQRVKWRGIDYQINRRSQIEMLNYVPYSQVDKTNSHSIY